MVGLSHSLQLCPAAGYLNHLVMKQNRWLAFGGVDRKLAAKKESFEKFFFFFLRCTKFREKGGPEPMTFMHDVPSSTVGMAASRPSTLSIDSLPLSSGSFPVWHVRICTKCENETVSDEG